MRGQMKENVLRIQGGLLVRNTVLTFVSQVIPALLALVTIPYLFRGLGQERFGVLGLLWAVLGYFTVFDLMSRATVKFVAEYHGRNELDKMPGIIWTSLGLQTTLGIAGAAILAAAATLFATRVLQISANLTQESKEAFWIVALALPVVICARNLRGVLEARQRFDLVAMIQIPTTSAVWLMPALGILWNFRLPGIMMLISFCWVVNALAYLALSLRLYPTMRKWVLDRQIIRPLLSYGGWITLCNILVAVIGSLDRLLISALISVQALAYYTPPTEMVLRLMIIPGVLGMTLLPAFSTLSVANTHSVERLYARSLKYVVLLIGPAVAVSVTFAKEILSLWLGREFAAKSVSVFQLLLVGMFFTALGHMPANLLDGVGRPDLRAKTFLVCAGVYVPLVCVLIAKIGLAGAALAWAIKAALELCIFLRHSRQLLPLPPSTLASVGFPKAVMSVAALVIVTTAIRVTVPVLWVQVLGVAMVVLAFAAVSWRYAFDSSDRGGLSAALTWGRKKEQTTIQLSPAP